MAPDQKTQLIESLQDVEWVSMPRQMKLSRMYIIVEFDFDEKVVVFSWKWSRSSLCCAYSYYVGMCGDGANDCGVGSSLHLINV